MNKLLSLFLIFTLTIKSQTINGKIIDLNSEPLSGASVIVSNLTNNNIIAYDISDIKGHYTINIKAKLDSVRIEVSYLGYTSQSKSISPKTKTINFTLLESNETLKEVFVKTKAIIQKGDTLSYSVSAFKTKKDRVIADVIKKMPGIDVLADGKILYQGIPIQKYYIEGLDLLEGKYNLANNNIPASSVLKIQILENHQPIKILDSLVFSDKTSLNIKLKHKITTTGSAKLGTGFSPALWNVNITPMLFAKNKQMISSYQTNNVGYDSANELKYLTLEEWLNKIEGFNDENWLNTNKLANPQFSNERWLNNNIHMLSTNLLLRVKKDTDFKINLSYINDYQQQQGTSKTTYFTPNTKINVSERTKNDSYKNSLKTKLIYNVNSKKTFIKNTFSFNKRWDTDKSKMLSNFNNNNQIQNNNNYSISNKLKYTFPINKKLINFKSVIGYNKNPEILSVKFNKKQNINNTYYYKTFNQKINYSNLYSNNHIGFTKNINKITVSNNLGLKTFNKQLVSNLNLYLDNTQIDLPQIYRNNLFSNKFEIYDKINAFYKSNTWKFSLKTPISYLNIFFKDKNLMKKQSINTFVINPNLSISNQINPKWKIALNINKRTNYGDIRQLYFAYILPNYNSIQLYDNPLLKRRILSSRISFIHKNPIKSLFYNFGYSYNLTNKNLISGLKIQNDGISTYGLLKIDNNSKTHRFNLEFSKYFSDIKTSFSINSNFSKEQSSQIINNNLTPINANNVFIKTKINSNIFSWLTIDTKMDFTFLKSNYSSIKSEKYLFDINFFPLSNQYISLNVDFYKIKTSYTKQENYFLNLNYKYQFKKSKIDLELNWNNILNTKYFIQGYNNEYSQSISSYNLRPSQILLSAKFSLEGVF